MIDFKEQIERIIALHEGKYWIAMEREALPLLLEMQAELTALKKIVDNALAADCFEEAFEMLAEGRARLSR